ncbi:MAG: hypothetical protein WCR21_09750 [Bacteroidota bacterium]
MKLTKYIIFLALFFNYKLRAQPANYVSNGGFEELIGCCNNDPNCSVKYWYDIDTLNPLILYPTYCTGNPFYGFGFQYPRSGLTFVVFDIFCPSCQYPFTRTYAKNRLKSKLIKGQTYCVKFWVNIGNNSGYGIDGFDAYFSTNALDTVIKKHLPITFVNAQIKNPVNNIITDTLKWTAITGTFTADGTEKFMIIGDFRTDANTKKQLIVPVNPNFFLSEICLDDVSCIPIDLPAAAGPDRHFLPGEKIYLGRARDVEIDESCLWYKLPNMITPIDTGAGIFVSPIQTSTYVVRQQLWCSGVKWDTVVVYQDFVGINEIMMGSDGIVFKFDVVPNPTLGSIKITCNKPITNAFRLTIINPLLEVLFSKEKHQLEEEIEISFLPHGLYYLKLEDASGSCLLKVLKE